MVDLTIGVEDTRHTDIDTVLTVVAVGECLRYTLTLIVAGTGANRVHMPPAVVILTKDQKF